MATFQQQKDELMKFYDVTHELSKTHQQTYGKLVNKLNESKGITQVLSNNLDDFMEKSFPKFAEFRHKINVKPFDESTVEFTFDINKNEYVQEFSLPDRKIVREYNKTIDLYASHLDLNHLVILKPEEHFHSSCNAVICSRSTHSVTYTGTGDPKCSQCNDHNPSMRMPQTLTPNLVKRQSANISFIVDDYFNIYIPAIKTYMVYNYSKFPLYSFFINQDNLEIHHKHQHILYGANRKGTEFNNTHDFFTNSANYLTSIDKRNQYIPKFKHMLEFYKYDEKLTHFKQFLALSEQIHKISPSESRVGSENNTEASQESMFAQSQRIIKIENEQLKSADELELLRSIKIEKEQALQNKTKIIADMTKLIEELNDQLRSQIDATTVNQKEILTMKTKLTMAMEHKIKSREVEDNNELLTNKIQDQDISIVELKTLNNSLIDKQLTTTQTVVDERQTIKELNSKIIEITKQLENKDADVITTQSHLDIERDQHRQSTAKLDAVIVQFNEISSETNKDEYSNLLVKQLKEKQTEIETLQQSAVSKTDSYNVLEKKHELLRSKLGKLL